MKTNKIKNYIKPSVITLDGQVNPQNNHALIVIGGIGSGKTTFETRQTLFQGKIIGFDPYREKLTNFTKKIFSNTLCDSLKNGILVKNPHIINRITPFNMKDSNDMSIINEISGRSGNKKKKNYVKTTKNGFYNAYKNQKNKPNLLFEIGNHIEDGLEDIISFLNLLGGYKITLVWLVTNRKVAACSMYKRNRQLTDGIFHKSHNEMWDCENGVIQVINKKYKNIINDFYMVFNSSFDIIDGVRYERYLTLEERQHNILTLQRNNNNEYIMPTTIKLNGIDDIKIDDIIDIKKVGYINPNCRYQKPLNFKTIKNQDKQEINEEYFPKYKDCVKWAETHNGQLIKNVLV
jgi:hypothetical protein